MQEEEQRKIAESLNEHNVESDANKRQTQVFMKSEKSTINDREEKLPIINIQQLNITTPVLKTAVNFFPKSDITI